MGSSAALSPLGSPAGQASGLRLAAAARAAPELEDLDAFPRGFSRDGFVVVPLHGLFRGAAVRTLYPEPSSSWCSPWTASSAAPRCGRAPCLTL